MASQSMQRRAKRPLLAKIAAFALLIFTGSFALSAPAYAEDPPVVDPIGSISGGCVVETFVITATGAAGTFGANAYIGVNGVEAASLAVDPNSPFSLSYTVPLAEGTAFTADLQFGDVYGTADVLDSESFTIDCVAPDPDPDPEPDYGIAGTPYPNSSDSNKPGYWEDAGPHDDALCYKHEGTEMWDNDHAYLTNDGKTVVLKPYGASWPGDHYETLIVKAANTDLVNIHPVAGLPGYKAVETKEISHYIVCKGTMPPPPPPPPGPQTCEPYGTWYTEDTAPIQGQNGLIFAGPSGPAINWLHPVTGNLQGLTGLSYTIADAGGYHAALRIVLNPNADLADGTSGNVIHYGSVVIEPYHNGWAPGQTGTFTVTGTTVAWTSKIANGNPGSQSLPVPLADMAALMEDNSLISIGLHLGTNSIAGQFSTISAITGCVNDNFVPEVPEPGGFDTEDDPDCSVWPGSVKVTHSSYTWVWDNEAHEYQKVWSYSVSYRDATTEECPPTTVDITAGPSVTAPTCDAGGTLVIPTIEHVTFAGGVNGDGPGEYTITASAEDGYTLTGDVGPWKLTVLSEKTNGCEPALAFTGGTINGTLAPLAALLVAVGAIGLASVRTLRRQAQPTE